MPTYVYDLETYPNYLLAALKEVSPERNRPIATFTWEQKDDLIQFLGQAELTLAGYNNHNFDDPLIKGIISGDLATLDNVYGAVEALIARDRENPAVRKLKELRPSFFTIDLMQILGGPRAGSLKSHEVRLGMLNVQTLPIEPGTILTDSDKELITSYCTNDINATEALYFDALERIEVRHRVNERYPHLRGSALRRSDASIAEEVMIGELADRAGFDKAKYRPPSSFSFDPDRQIDPAIAFSSAVNQAALDRLRGFGRFDPAEWAKRHSNGFTFQVGTHHITLGQGGLHTDIGPTLVRSSNILEFDVASYYPNLMLKADRHPEMLPRKWIDILRDLTRDRLDAKKAANKTMADVYKIVINSIYGKLADPYSINLDLGLQLQVVLNGQLFLLMLMERFADQGFRVISANTDGLYVDAGDRAAEAVVVAEQWQTDTGFQLESKTATIFAATSVNDYALFDTEKGWFHTKGRFGRGNRTAPNVIHAAAINHISSGISVESHINGEPNILEFLYSRSVKGATRVSHGDATVQKVNRWYKGIAGYPLYKHTASETGESVGKVPGSDGAVIANRLTDYSVPADLDISFYSKAAQELVDQLSQPHGMTATSPSKRVKDAKRAQQMGLVIAPKGRRHEPKANIPATFSQSVIDHWRQTPAEQAEWGEYEGYGCYTGPDFGVIALDIDDPSLAAKTGIFEHMSTAKMVAWHGNGKADDIKSGRKSGTVVFKYDGTNLKTTGAAFRRNYGFEILYGKRLVQLGGFHTSKEPYRWTGKPTALPGPLLDLLNWMIPDDTDPAASGEEPGIVQMLEAFRDLANQDDQYIAEAEPLVFATDKDNRVHLKGRCIGHKLHSDPSQTSPMKVSVWQGQIRVSCFHMSCEQARTAWQAKIASQLVVLRPAKVDPAKMIVHSDHAEVWAALNDPAKNKLIIASTGAGKTYGVVNYIVSKLVETDSLSKKTRDKFVIICSSKDQMRQIGERFATVLESGNINAHGIDLIEAEEALVIGQACSIGEVRGTTRVAITHYTYVSRRQFSSEYYAFIRFIDDRTHVFIDEVDAFVSSQTASVALGSRFRRIGSNGITNNVRMHKCGMHGGFNNCRNCFMHMHDGFKISVDKFGVPTYAPREEFIDADQNKALERVEIDDRELARVNVGTTEVRMLRQEDDPGEMKFWDNHPLTADGKPKTAPSFAEMFYDLLQSAYLPTAHRPLILWDDKEVDRKEIVARYQFGVRGHKLMIPDKDKARLKFPSRPCNVINVTLIDRRPLTRMGKAKSVTMLSATVTSMHQRFLSETLGGLTRTDIHPPVERRMDKIIVVGIFRSIPTKLVAEGKWQFKKLLRFRETKMAAVRDFAKLRMSNLVVRFGHNKSEFTVNAEMVDKDHNVLLTYSLGSLGRGMDLPHYDVVSVNAGVFKPISAYVTNDPEKVRELIYEDRSNTVLQNLGRVLRRVPESSDRATKIVVLEDIESEDELDYIAARLGGMSAEPVETWWAPEYLSMEDACLWLTKICLTHTLPADLPRGPQDLIGAAKKMVVAGLSKKEIKQKLRWPVVRKKVDADLLNAIEQQIDQALQDRSPDVRRAALKSEDKIGKMRQSRGQKILQLMASGKSDGQIRSNMKVYNTKQGWHDDEAKWFEAYLSAQRERLKTAE
jgi:hypothetical protein